MKRLTFSMLTILLLFTAAFSAEENLLDKAKVLLFDQKWEPALTVLDDFLAQRPKPEDTAQALFFRGTCLKELGRDLEAMGSFRNFLVLSNNAALREEAMINMVDLNVSLFKKGDKSAGQRLVSRLKEKNRTVRYYAAFRLSYIQDKTLARTAIPVLKDIVENEKDRELKERAKLALLRIDPKALEGVQQTDKLAGRMLRINIVDKNSNEEKVAITIPLSLARVALSALPDSEKERLAAEGYDLDTIIENLIRTGEVVRIEDEEAKIRIWIE